MPDTYTVYRCVLVSEGAVACAGRKGITPGQSPRIDEPSTFAGEKNNDNDKVLYEINGRRGETVATNAILMNIITTPALD